MLLVLCVGVDVLCLLFTHILLITCASLRIYCSYNWAMITTSPHPFQHNQQRSITSHKHLHVTHRLSFISIIMHNWADLTESHYNTSFHSLPPSYLIPLLGTSLILHAGVLSNSSLPTEMRTSRQATRGRVWVNLLIFNPNHWARIPLG